MFLQNDKNSISNKLIPVLIYINDGDWLSRLDSYNLHPKTAIKDFACNVNAILVTFQYRMGFYGF